MTRRIPDPDRYLSRLHATIARLELSGSVTLDLAARQMNTSPRTLQRRLCKQGTQFSSIVEEARLGFAGALLRET